MTKVLTLDVVRIYVNGQFFLVLFVKILGSNLGEGIQLRLKKKKKGKKKRKENRKMGTSVRWGIGQLFAGGRPWLPKLLV